MGHNLTQKIIQRHLARTEGDAGLPSPGAEIGLVIDQTLTQDATGTMTYLQFEAMGLPRVRTDLSVSYVDHNMLQTDFRNADDHRYLQGVAAKYGLYYSRPGNGICHQVHLERFARPGATLLGADSHTPTAGGVGSLAIGAGGLDVALAMAGQPFFVPMPKVVGVRLTGRLSGWATAKDVILELLRILSVKGGVGRVIEYHGPGVATLTVPERAAITNMGAELGATSSIFPSDELTRAYLAAQGREEAWELWAADPDAGYDEEVDIDLSALEPLVAAPHSPDAVQPITAVAGRRVDQVCVGSCTNSSVMDLELLAALVRGKTVAPGVSFTVNPGSKQALSMIARSGALADLIAAGARVQDPGCGPCIGMGQAPASGAVSVRSFNRNFPGRSGTDDAEVYLAGLPVCAAAALTGALADPRTLGEAPAVEMPDRFLVDDNMIVPPAEDPGAVEIVRGPNIKPLPTRGPLEEVLQGELLLVTGDNITTDHIMPAGAEVLPLRSNIPAMSDHCFARVDRTFPSRAREAGGGFIVGGENYGQGSSREHAALVPMHLGVKAVIVKSFARIHKANLVNCGILPLEFADPADYERLAQGDTLRLTDVVGRLRRNEPLALENVTQGVTIPVRQALSDRQVEALLAGGLLNLVRAQA